MGRTKNGAEEFFEQHKDLYAKESRQAELDSAQLMQEMNDASDKTKYPVSKDYGDDVFITSTDGFYFTPEGKFITADQAIKRFNEGWDYWITTSGYE